MLHKGVQVRVFRASGNKFCCEVFYERATKMA